MFVKTIKIKKKEKKKKELANNCAQTVIEKPFKTSMSVKL